MTKMLMSDDYFVYDTSHFGIENIYFYSPYAMYFMKSKIDYIFAWVV